MWLAQLFERWKRHSIQVEAANIRGFTRSAVDHNKENTRALGDLNGVRGWLHQCPAFKDERLVFVKEPYICHYCEWGFAEWLGPTKSKILMSPEEALP